MKIVILGTVLVLAVVSLAAYTTQPTEIEYESITINLPDSKNLSGKILVTVQDTNNTSPQEIEFFLDEHRYFTAYPFQPQFQATATLMFDDGWDDVYINAKPVLQTFNYPATLGIIKNYTGNPGAISLKQLHELSGLGWEITSHSISDTSLLALSTEQANESLKESKRFLQQNYFAARNFVIPYGDYNQQLIALVQKHYLSARPYDGGYNSFPPQPFNLKIKSLEDSTTFEQVKDWIDTTKRDNLWLIMVGHHVRSEKTDQYTITPSLLEEILSYLKTKSLPVKTLDQVLQESIQVLAGIKDGQGHLELDTTHYENGRHTIFARVDQEKSTTRHVNFAN